MQVRIDTARLDAIFAGVNQCQLPGAAVGIAVAGRPVYRKGFGLANMELPVILTPAMRMRIASMTKPFTCLAYLTLCHDGRADLDDPIGQYLPEVHPVMHAITVRQLMGHIGGNRDAHDICYQFSGTGRAVSSRELFDLYRDMSELNSVPGSTFCYNNGGYLLLSLAIERIADQSLEDVLRERIFEPMGMHDSLLRRVDTDFVPNSAALHMKQGDGSYEKSYIGTAYAGEGGMVSTVDDMLRWLACMERPGRATRDAWEIMRTPQRLINGTHTGYGLGLVSDRYRGVETISHAGGLMGGNSHMLKVPAAGLDIVIMVNRHDVVGVLLVNQILDACLPGLEPVGEPREGDLMTGRFQSASTGRVIELFSKDGQQHASVDAFDIPMTHESKHVLRPAGLFATPHQRLEVSGNSVRWSAFGHTDDLLPIPETAANEWQLITGTYESAEARAAVTITRTENGARLDAAGSFGSTTYELICLGCRVWRAKSSSPMPWGGILSFAEDFGSFGFSNYRTHALRFRRRAL